MIGANTRFGFRFGLLAATLLGASSAGAATVKLAYNGLLTNDIGGSTKFLLTLSGDGITEGAANYAFDDADEITASAIVDGQAIEFVVTGYGGSGNLIYNSYYDAYIVQTYPYIGLNIDLQESTTQPGQVTSWAFYSEFEDGYSCSGNPYNCENYSTLVKLPYTNADLVYDNYSLDSRAISFNVVPIPAAAWLFGSALAGLGWLRRKPA